MHFSLAFHLLFRATSHDMAVALETSRQAGIGEVQGPGICWCLGPARSPCCGTLSLIAQLHYPLLPLPPPLSPTHPLSSKHGLGDG